MKTLEFPFSSFARKPDSSPTLNSGFAAHRTEAKMPRSADFISFDSAAAPSPPLSSSCSSASPSSSASGDSSDKVHLDVEEGDDYNSDEDIDDLPLRINYDSPIHSPLRQSGSISNSNGKRPADDLLVSHGSQDDAKRQRLVPSKALVIPENIWADIFSRLPPQQLAQLRRTCRLFKKYLLNQSIWRASRKQWMPEMPKPVFNLKEWEMLALAKGDGCMICGNKTHTRSIYWAFRVRCCTQCFNQNMTKETSLADSDFPVVLLTALPYGFIDPSGQWVPNAMGQYTGGGLTKVYWNADLKSIRERYEEAKAMNAEEEWLKGLETEGIENKVDVIRMESFESRWYTRGKSKVGANLTKFASHGASMNNYGSRGNQTRPNWYQFQPNRPISHSQSPPHAHQLTPPPHLAMPQTQFTHIHQHAHPAPVIFQGQQGPLTPGGSWSGGYISGQHPPPKKHSHPRGPVARTERSISEAIEVRARRQQEIEARCMSLEPPLLPNVLQHIPAFKASIMIAIPLNEQAWEILLPKLLEQRKEAEEKERAKAQGQIQLQKQLEEKKAHDALQRELKEKNEREWDEVQAPVKAKLDYYASEIINLWLARNPANQHPSINKDSALRFAPEVLVQVRQRFYEENPYTSQDPNHMVMLDPSSPDGAATLKTPTGKRLLLENMKYVFDTKIKPITDQVRKELFLCSGCENNPKLYSFEGVIQHYAAKHTNLMSLGSIIVHWKSDWPHNPPFLLGPQAVGMKHVTHASHHQFQVNHSGPNSAFGAFNTTHRMGMQMSTQMEISHQTMITNGYPNEGAYINGVFTTFPVSQQQQQCAPHTNGGPMMQTININTPVQVSTSVAPCQQQLDHQRAQWDEIAVTAREAWFQLNGIKDLPSSVRVHYVIQKVIKSFQAKFPPFIPQLHMFIETLKEHNLMKPMRNVNGLQCLACTINPPHSNNASNGVGRVFTLLSLAQHFEMVHVLRNRSPIKMDWKTQMIKLPESRVIGMLRDAMGMDEAKLRLLKEVFPVAFNLPLPMRNTGGFAPSPGPFPKPTQSVTPSSSIAASSPSPLRSVGSNGTSPSSEQCSGSQSPLADTPSPSPTQKSIKRELSLEAESRVNSAPITKNESREPSPEPRASRRAHINAAEKFLERFMQNDACEDNSLETVEREATEQRKRRKLENEERDEAGSRSPARPITPRSESPYSPMRSKLDNIESHSPALDGYYRQRSPIREEAFSRVGRRPTSRCESRYSGLDGHLDYLPPRSPRSRSPQRGRTDACLAEERGRVYHPRPYSPHSRSRSPRQRYLARYYDHDYRVGLYPRDSLQYMRDCDYEEGRRGSVGPVSRQPMISPDSRYYDPLYEKGWYVDEIIAPTRATRERSRSPLPELASRSHPLPRDYKYSYISPVSPHSAPYYPYPPVRPPYPTPYLEDARYVREARSRSPVYGLDPKRASSITSRHPTKVYHAHSPLPAPLRGHDRYNDEEGYHSERRYREWDHTVTMRDYFDRPGSQHPFDDIPAPRSRIDEDDPRY